MDLFIAIFTGTIIAATPLIYAALGELVVEKSGVLNLGIEGMMLMGAAFAFWAVIAGLPMPVAILCGALAGVVASLLFGVLALTFLTNQYAAGLALAIFGSGVSAFLGRGFGSAPIDALKRIRIPGLSDIPVVGPMFFRFDPMVYLALLLFGLITSLGFVGQARNMHTQIDRERDRQVMLAPSLTWAPSDATSLTLHGYYQHDRPVFSPRFYPAVGTLLPNANGQIPRSLYLGDPNANVFERDFYTAGYEFSHEFNDTWTVRQNLRYGRSSQNMFLALVNPAFAYQPDGHTLNRASALSDDWVSSFNVDNQAEARFRTGTFDHTALLGLDYLRATSDTNFGNTGPGVVVPSLDFLNPVYGSAVIPVPAYQRSGLQKQQQVGLYAQDQIRYDRWVGTFGLRYDVSDIDTTDRLSGKTVSTEDRQLTGRAGLTYLFDNGLAPYASYSTAFIPALGTDRFGNPFDAQTASQFEVGVKYEPPGGRGLVSLSLFDLTLDNALTPDPANSLFSVSTGKQRVRGLEIEGKYELTGSLDLLASYAYSDSEILESNRASELGREMLRLPKHQASLWVNYRPDAVPGLAVNAGVRYMSSYQTDTTYLSQLRIPARTLVDIGADYDFGALDKEFEGTRLRVNVSNLFNTEYVSHCLNITGGSCNYGAGRAITASLKYTW